MVKLKAPFNEELAKVRAKRIKGLRKYLKISAAKLCNKYSHFGLTKGGLHGWEEVRWHGLTENGATILARVFQEEGLNVTVEWLLFGVGDSPLPTLLTYANNEAPKKNAGSEKELIARELEIFYQHYPNSVDTIIKDDGLAPALMPGDYVAAICYTGNNMEKAIGHNSIVQLEDKKILVRMVKPGNDIGLYTLLCTNPNTVVNPTEKKDIKLLSAAPIIWIRKPIVKK